MSATTAYVEHTAFFVRDIVPMIDFFAEVLGMGVTKRDGTQEAPTQVWLQGGIQLIADPNFTGPEGRFGHLGIVCKDVPAAIEASRPAVQSPLQRATIGFFWKMASCWNSCRRRATQWR